MTVRCHVEKINKSLMLLPSGANQSECLYTKLSEVLFVWW